MAKHESKERADERGEAFLKGRRAGVEESYGRDGKPYRGVGQGTGRTSAEATNLSRDENHDSGGHEELASAASKLYSDAKHNRGDRFGDKALTER